MNRSPGALRQRGVETERSDGDLIRALPDDQGALRLLYDRHAPWLMLRLGKRCADPTLVDEVIQDTFMALWKKPRAYEGSGEVGAYLWGIGIRRLIDHLRRGRRHDLLRYEEPEVVVSAEERALLGVEYGDLGGALNALSPELRAVVQATILDGLTTREAGHLLGIPAGTVKTRVMRAKAQLRGELA